MITGHETGRYHGGWAEGRDKFLYKRASLMIYLGISKSHSTNRFVYWFIEKLDQQIRVLVYRETV